MLSAATVRKSKNRVFITYYKEGQKLTPFSVPDRQPCKVIIINKKKKRG